MIINDVIYIIDIYIYIYIYIYNYIYIAHVEAFGGIGRVGGRSRDSWRTGAAALTRQGSSQPATSW